MIRKILCLIAFIALNPIAQAATCEFSIYQYEAGQITCGKLYKALLPTDLRVGSYNLHGLRNTAGLKKDLAAQPSVVMWGFEEISGHKGDTVPPALLEILPDGIWYIYIQQVNVIDDSTGDWEGQAIVSRFPFLKVESLPLAHTDPKTRVALIASFKNFNFIDTDHEVRVGGIDFNDRKKQLESLNQYLATNSLPTLITGDFNTTGGTKEIQQTEEVLAASGLVRSPSATSSTYTFRKYIYTAELDHMFSRGLSASKRHRYDERVGSDHYPVVVDLTF